MRDPLENTETRGTRPWVWLAALVAVTVLYARLFPGVFAMVAVILSLPLIIFLHELAHFVTAKRTGMKVTEFFVGFGPRLWSFRRGETEYGVKAIVLGGYCKIIGMTNLEEVAPDDEPRAYRSKRYPAKLLVASAGSAMHFALALVLMFTVLWVGGNFREAELTTTLSFVEQDSPADRAGLEPGDRVVAVDGVEIAQWRELFDYLGARSEGDTVTFVVERGGTTESIPVTLEESTIGGVTRVRAGIAPGEHVPELSVGAALVEAPKQTWDLGVTSVKALGSMFSPSGIANYFDVLTGDDAADEDMRFVSPYGFGRLATDAVRSGWVNTFGLLIAINVFVGLFNLVPLLPFDGGHIAIATYERVMSAIRRRPVRVDVAKLLPLTAAVVAVLGFIFLSSLFLDVTRPLENPF